MSMLPRSLTWSVAYLTAHVLHVKLLREDGFCERSSHGSPDSFTPRMPLSRYPGNPKTSQSLRHTSGSQVQDVNLSSRKYKKTYRTVVVKPPLKLELELIQSHMTQKPMLRGEVGACRFAQLTSTAKR